VWLVYIKVDDLDVAIGRCLELDGKVLRPAAGMGSNGRFLCDTGSGRRHLRAF
jgi:predicted enzyme related to lactoylglutathione lyase